MTTNSSDTSNNSISQRVMVGLSKISLALKSHAWQEAGQQGLTPTQAQILALLNSKSNLPMRLSEVADGLAVTPATASDAVATLVEKGLVKKGRAVDDARAIAITLTEQGQREAESTASWPDFLLSTVDGLSVIEKEVFLRVLIKMVRELQERGQIPVARMCVNCRFFRPNVYSNSQHPHHCNLVNAPFGNLELRLDCPEHIAAEAKDAEQAWQVFLSPQPGS